jgi:hypothetical protein
MELAQDRSLVLSSSSSSRDELIINDGDASTHLPIL